MRSITRLILALGLLAGMTLTSSMAAVAQSPGTQIKITQVDNSKFPQVTVYVSVTNAAGEPVAVDPSTIQITENGKAMQPTFQGGGGQGGVGPLTTMLVMDVSGSMNANNKLAGAKTAAKAYVDQMRPGDQAGIITFNTRAHYIQSLTQDHSALSKAIDGIQAAGNTAMFDALTTAEDALKDVPGRKAIIAVTDGLDNSSSHNAANVLSSVGQGGLSISTIGLGDASTKTLGGLDEVGLKSLAEQAGGGYSFAGDSQTLSALFQSYGRALQSEYAITYTSPATLRDGVNRTLSVSLAGGAAAAQKAYNPGGVLPEVPTQSWLLFGLLLAGLLVLLFVPALVGLGSRGLGGIRGGAKKGRVKLGTPSGAPTASMARGRVKLK
jgi:VWFA-related protein